MTTAVVVSGRLTNEGNLELDEPIPLAAGPVRVRVETVAVNGSSFQWPSDEDLRQRKADMLQCVGCLSDAEAKEMLEVIEREFEQIDPDEWR